MPGDKQKHKQEECPPDYLAEQKNYSQKDDTLHGNFEGSERPELLKLLAER